MSKTIIVIFIMSPIPLIGGPKLKIVTFPVVIKFKTDSLSLGIEIKVAIEAFLEGDIQGSRGSVLGSGGYPEVHIKVLIPKNKHNVQKQR